MTLRPLLLQLLAVPLAVAPVAADVWWGHTFPPYGLLLSPVVAVLACAVLLSAAGPWHPYPKAGLCAGLLMLQDAGLKLYAGGAHDAEGQGLSTFIFLLGALLSVVMLAVVLRRNPRSATVPTAGASGLFTALLVAHLLLFARLGQAL